MLLENQRFDGRPPSLAKTSWMAPESWSGCLFAASAITLASQGTASRAAISDLARRPVGSPSSIKRIFEKR